MFEGGVVAIVTMIHQCWLATIGRLKMVDSPFHGSFNDVYKGFDCLFIYLAFWYVLMGK
jgi:hypothetical protein